MQWNEGWDGMGIGLGYGKKKEVWLQSTINSWKLFFYLDKQTNEKELLRTCSFVFYSFPLCLPFLFVLFFFITVLLVSFVTNI